MLSLKRFNLLFVTVAVLVSLASAKTLTTQDRIVKNGLKAEKHLVTTKDGYILSLFRVLPKNAGKKGVTPPVVYLQHGLISSSDCWVLNGRENSLAFILADAGYDVWLGNSRGNTYSRRNVRLTPANPNFWSFSWHEIGIYDVPASIDYILKTTKESALHYVGHSQGTTAFMVMLAELPEYSKKIKTSHMLAPVVYMNHMESPLAKALGSLLGTPSVMSSLIGDHEFLPNKKLLSTLGSIACKSTSPFEEMCSNILFLLSGWDSKHLNTTLLPSVFETHPAGASTSQVIHYLQEYQSGDFRQYDYGWVTNLKAYGSMTPPVYPINKIKPKKHIYLYYSDNDYMSSPVDVKRFAGKMGSRVKMEHMKYHDWNHIDFLWANDVKKQINEPILKRVKKYEKKLAKKQ